MWKRLLNVRDSAGVRRKGGLQGAKGSPRILNINLAHQIVFYLTVYCLNLSFKYLDVWHVGLCTLVPVGGDTESLPYPLQSEHFKTTSQKVARKFWWKNVKMIVIICVIVFIIILFIVLFATNVIP